MSKYLKVWVDGVNGIKPEEIETILVESKEFKALDTLSRIHIMGGVLENAKDIFMELLAEQYKSEKDSGKLNKDAYYGALFSYDYAVRRVQSDYAFRKMKRYEPWADKIVRP